MQRLHFPISSSVSCVRCGLSPWTLVRLGIYFKLPIQHLLRVTVTTEKKQDNDATNAPSSLSLLPSSPSLDKPNHLNLLAFSPTFSFLFAKPNNSISLFTINRKYKGFLPLNKIFFLGETPV